MTIATKLAASIILVAVALALAFLVTSRAYAQQSCTQVKMIYSEAWNTLYMIDGNGNRLVDIRNGNTLNNNQVGSYIVLRGIPSRIGIEIEGTGEKKYEYRTSVWQTGDRGYEDESDNDFNDAVILLSSISCPGAGTPPQLHRGAPNPPNTPSPSIQSVGADNITETTARAVVNIADHDGTELTVRLRYQQKADVQDWTTDVETAEATSSTSQATKSLENLSPDTQYVLQATLDSTFPDNATKEHTFTTERQPSVRSVSVGNIKWTSAKATINIADSNGSTQTAKLQYRSTSPQGQWSMPALEEISIGATVQIDLSGLTSDTVYEVQAFLDSSFPDKRTAYTSFRTLRYPSISNLEVNDETQTTADAVITIADPDGSSQTVHVRYRTTTPQGEWSDIQKATTSTDSAEVKLSGLTPDTGYEAEASLTSDFSVSETDIFRTLPPDPVVSGVSIDDETQTAATANISIANANGSSQTVHLRYRTATPQGEWSDTQATASTTDSAEVGLSGLTPDTDYEVEASLTSDFSVSETDIFRTLRYPSISKLEVNDETQTTANAVITIADPDGTSQTVHMRYRTTTPQGEWSDTQETTSTTDSAEIKLSGLTSDTEYEAEASLTSDFSVSETDIFRTLPPDPVVSGVSIDNETQTAAIANISITNANGSSQTVHLRYRTTTPQGEWSGIQKTTSTTDGAGIRLSGLTANTEYDVQASLDSSFPDERTAYTSFKTLRYPSISKLEVKDETQTTAAAVITIADPDGSSQTVHVRYRTTTPQGEWSSIHKTTSTTDGAGIRLSGLIANTEYDVQASLDSSFPDERTAYTSFRTLRYPSISKLEVNDETQTTANAVITIADPDGSSQTVHVRYRTTAPQGEWSDTQKTTSTTDSAEIELSGLTPDTEYEAEASLTSDFSVSETDIFRTLPPDPVVSGVSIDNETQTAATANISIANANGSSQTVHLRYRTTTPQGEWSDTQATASTTNSAKIGMSGLTADTEYDVQASLDSSFPDERTVHTSFRTLRYPSISKLEVNDETQTTANAVITIANPDGSSQTVHLRYRTTTPQGEWSDTQETTSTTDSAEVNLSGLTSDTEYEAEASLTSDFSVSETDIFRTLPPDPVVSGVSIDGETQNAATANISIANANGSSQTVHLRYRTTTPQGEWSETQKTTSTTDSAEIGLSGLTANTEYDVQASLDSSFPDERTVHTSFTTLRTPSVESVEVVHIGRNGATVRAVIADSGGISQTVYFRHRDKRYDLWRPTQQADSANDVASTRLRLLISGTEYIVEVSLSDSFPEDKTESLTFTTKRRKEDVSDSEGTTGVVPAAQSAYVPQPGISPMALIFSAVEGGDSPAPQTVRVWNRTYEPMNFTLSSRADWLSQEPTSGTSNGPDDAVPITVSVDSSNLPPGQYVDVIYIKVSTSKKAPEQIVVMLEVLPPDYVRQFVPRNEGGVVVLPDGTVKLLVQSFSPPRDVDVELMKVNLQAHGSAPTAHERVVLALETNTYEPDAKSSIDVVYTPKAELWMRLRKEDTSVCDEGRARVYSVVSGQWHLMEHRCEREESGYAWVVTKVERLGKFVLTIDDAPATATPAPAALAAPSGFVTRVATPAARQTSMPAQDPTPAPTPAPLPIPDRKLVVASAFMPTPTPMPMPTATATVTVAEKAEPVVKTSSVEQSSGGFNEIILAAIGVPLTIGAVVVVFLVYRERRRNGYRQA